MQVAVVSHAGTRGLARLTAREASRVAPAGSVHVLDVDGSYRPAGQEVVHPPVRPGLPAHELRGRAAVLAPDELADALTPGFLRELCEGSDPTDVVLLLRPGLLLLREPVAVLEPAAREGLCLVAGTRAADAGDGRHPDLADLARTGGHARGLVALRADQHAVLDLAEAAVRDELPVGRLLDLLAALVPHRTVRDAATVLGPHSLRPEHRVGRGVAGELTLDDEPVTAVDLTGLDPDAPWLLDGASTGDPRARLSDHPELARFVRDTVASLALTRASDDRAPAWDLATTGLGTPVDATVRAAFRAAGATASARGTERLPDLFDPAGAEVLLRWLSEPGADGWPGRYLRALLATRPDLRAAFPRVPGADAEGFRAWAAKHAVADGHPADLVAACLAQPAEPSRPIGRPQPGVNVVGFLRGELGIGESARLLLSALDAAGIPSRSTSVDRFAASRQHAPGGPDDATDEPVLETTVLCVNADLTPAVSAAVPELVDRTYRIGMWYWEVEDFPVGQHGGFAHVDEVWVATDFVRRAIEQHSPVPVRTITPPLPQRGPDPSTSRADLGLPDRPLFLFTFDFLSTAERKNPLGLLEAFGRAFAPGTGPVLVVKSINADQRPAEAERLRLRAREHPDVLLLEQYLDAAERDALVALSDCYVSLHRSEGLGLTMAEAMAWGKPVIATGYSGNLQFMTDENSFLVPWTPTAIPPGAAPYPPGGVWAEPDLDAAAALLRLVVDRPDLAAARGARAARDIATLHTAEVAGHAVAERLAEIAGRRRARSRRVLLSRAASGARKVRDALG